MYSSFLIIVNCKGLARTFGVKEHSYLTTLPKHYSQELSTEDNAKDNKTDTRQGRYVV